MNPSVHRQYIPSVHRKSLHTDVRSKKASRAAYTVEPSRVDYTAAHTTHQVMKAEGIEEYQPFGQPVQFKDEGHHHGKY